LTGFGSIDPRLPEMGRELAMALLAAGIAVVIALVVHRLLYGLLNRLALASESQVDDLVVRALRAPTRYAMAALGIALAARESLILAEVWSKLVGFLMPALIGWIALAGLNAFVRAITIEADAASAGSKSARRRRTRLAIFARIGAFLIVFLTVGLMLLSIPGVRDVGLTLMASAGLAGLAVGAAAQPALRSLIAGLQMALTEPIAIGDMVTIDGHTGRVEDITTTYVVLRTEDARHVIVPTVKFLETTFQNLTRDGGG
jgi:small-conductance mechanosensitive channel